MKLDYPDYEIIVVDNNSTDDTEAVVKSYPDVVYAREERQGLAFARNKLLSVCNSDFLGILDDDETVKDDWINQMLECFSLDKNVIAVGGPYLPIYEIEKPGWLPDNFFVYKNELRGCKVYSKMSLAGGNAMIKVDVAKSRGVKFDVSLGYNGKNILSGEDVDFFDKLIQAGDVCGFTEYAPINHYIDKGKLTFRWILRTQTSHTKKLKETHSISRISRLKYNLILSYAL